MFRLQEDNITGTVLKHMIHCEDLVLRGQAGCNLAVRALKGFYSKIKTGQSDMTVTQKIDGAPAVVAASDFYGTQFIALKHSWDKGKIFKSETEIAEAYPDRPELVSKLTSIFKYLPLIEIPKNEIWMGDFLYSREDLRIREINEEKYITFCPNTLVYAVLADSSLGKRINRTEVGIAWHTRYSGQKDSLKMSFDVSVKELRQVPAIFQIDATLPEPKNRLETEDLSDIDYGFKELAYSVEDLVKADGYLTLCENPKAVLLLDTFRNAQIKEGNESLVYEQLQTWVENRFEKEAQTKKTEKGQAAVLARKNEMLGVLEPRLISNIYKVQNIIINLKEQLISLQNRQMPIQTFIEKTDGTLEPASGEGYAVSDIDGNIQKMVSRLGFSRANFSPDVKKGWMSDRRAEKETPIAEAKTNGTSWLLRLFERRTVMPLEQLLDFLQIAQAQDDYSSENGLKTIDFSQVDDNYSNKEVDYNFKVKSDITGDCRAERLQAYQDLENYINSLKNFPVSYERGKARDGGHTDWLKIIIRNTEAKITFRTNNQPGRGSGIGVLLKGLTDSTDPDFVTVTKQNLPTFKEVLFKNLEKVYAKSPEVIDIYRYFLEENGQDGYPIVTSNFSPNIQTALANNPKAIVNLAEILTPYWILTGCKYPGKSLLPQEFEGLNPQAIQFPMNESNKFIDSFITFYDTDQKLAISSKASTSLHGSTGSASALPVLEEIFKNTDIPMSADFKKSSLYEFMMNDTAPIKAETKNIIDKKIKPKQLSNKNFKWIKHGVPFWLYGCQLVGMNYPRPELIRHFYMFFDYCLAGVYNPGADLTQFKDKPLDKDFLPGGKIYQDYKQTLHNYLQSYNKQADEFKKERRKQNEKGTGAPYANYSVNEDNLNATFPKGLSTAFSYIVAYTLERDLTTKRLIAKQLNNFNYYQYALKLNPKQLTLTINKAGADQNNQINLDSFCLVHKQAAFDGDHIFTHNGRNLTFEVVKR